MNAKSRKSCVSIETKLEAIKSSIKGEIIKKIGFRICVGEVTAGD